MSKKQRAQTNDLNLAPSIEPQAAPLNTQPLAQAPPRIGRPVGLNTFEQLSQSLASLSPKLQKLEQERAQQQSNQGRLDQLKGDPATQQSFNYLKGHNQSELKAQTNQFIESFRVQYSQSELPSASLEDVSQAYEESVDKLVQQWGRDGFSKEDITEASLDRLIDYRERLLQSHSTNQQKRITQEYETSLSINITDSLDNTYQSSVSSIEDRNTNFSKMASVIQTLADEAVHNGFSGSDAVSIQTEALINKAYKELDPTMLFGVGDKVLIKGQPISSIGRVRSQLQRAQNTLIQRLEQLETAAQSKKEQQRKIVSRFIQSDVMIKLLDNPTADVSREIDNLALLDPLKAKTLKEYQNNAIDGLFKITEDPERVASVLAKVASGTYDYEDLIKDTVTSKQAGVGLSSGSVKSIASAINSRDRADEISSLSLKATVADHIKDLRTQLTKPSRLGSMFPDPATVFKANKAVGFYRVRANEIMQRDIPEDQKYDELSDLYNKIAQDTRFQQQTTVDVGGVKKSLGGPSQGFNVDSTLLERPNHTVATPSFGDSPEALQSALEEYNKTGGKSGAMVRFLQDHGKPAIPANIQKLKQMIEQDLGSSKVSPSGRELPASPLSLALPKAGVSFSGVIQNNAAKYGVEAELISAVIQAESNFNPKAVSRAGAVGMMQLMPGTAAGLRVKDSTNPEQNIEGGTKYLSQLLKRYNGDLVKALAAYNAGPGAVDKAGGVPNYKETKAYVNRVLKFYQSLKEKTQNFET